MMFARASLLVRWLPYIGGLAQRQNRAYANLNHLNISGWLSMRLAYLRMPFRLLGTISILLLGMLAFMLQVAERRVNHDLDEYANRVWLALVSMSGIGFGDLYPQTLLGRAASA